MFWLFESRQMSRLQAPEAEFQKSVVVADDFGFCVAKSLQMSLVLGTNGDQ